MLWVKPLLLLCQAKKGEQKAPKVDLSPLFKPRKESMLNRVAVSVGEGLGRWKGGVGVRGRGVGLGVEG